MRRPDEIGADLTDAERAHIADAVRHAEDRFKAGSIEVDFTMSDGDRPGLRDALADEMEEAGYRVCVSDSVVMVMRP